MEGKKGQVTRHKKDLPCGRQSIRDKWAFVLIVFGRYHSMTAAKSYEQFVIDSTLNLVKVIALKVLFKFDGGQLEEELL